MAFADYKAAATTSSTLNLTTHTFNLPASGISAGDLLLACISLDSDDFTSFDTSGWTQIGALSVPQVELKIYGKVAAGDEGGGTIQVTTSVVQHGVCSVSVIENWYGTLAGVEASTGATSSTAAHPDSDSLTPSWGSADTLWLSVAAVDTPQTVTTWPTNYDSLTTGFNRHHEDVAGSGNGVAIMVGVRQNATTTEDPGAYSIAVAEQYCAQTLAIRPAAAAGSTPKGPLGLALHGPFSGPV